MIRRGVVAEKDGECTSEKWRDESRERELEGGSVSVYM